MLLISPALIPASDLRTHILWLRDWSWTCECCWHQLLSGLSRRVGRSLGLRPRDRPARRDNPLGELMSTTPTYPWLIPIITRRQQFPSLSTNILLIKSKYGLESRAIVVGVVMSPSNYGGKYRCWPHPRWRKCTRQFFFPGTERVNRTASEWRHRLATTSSIMWCV